MKAFFVYVNTCSKIPNYVVLSGKAWWMRGREAERRRKGLDSLSCIMSLRNW